MSLCCKGAIERIILDFSEPGEEKLWVDVQFSVLQVHCPEVDSKAKDMENFRYTIVLIWKRLRLFFRIIASANQLSLYGAVAEMCEEYETLHDRLEQPVVVGQSSSSLVLSVIKTEVPLDCDDLANKDLVFEQYGERIEKLSQQDKLSKFIYGDYTLPREEASQPKGWIQGNTKIGTVLEIATSYLHGKYGVEIRFSSVNRDNSLLGQTFSWLE